MAEDDVVANIIVIDNATAALTKISKQLSRMTTSLGKATQNTTKIGKEMKTTGIRTLSLLFILRRVTSGLADLLKPAAEAYGIFDLWNTMLLVLFVPTMESLFPLFADMFNFFNNLPEPVQKAIGVLTLFALGAASLLGIGLMWGLLTTALQSFEIELPSLASLWESVIGGLSLPLVAFAAIFAAILLGIWLAWKENFGNIQAWGNAVFQNLKEVFSGWLEFVRGIFGMIKGILTGNFADFKNGFKQTIEGIVSAFTALPNAIASLLVVVGLGILKLGANIVKFGLDAGISFIHSLWDGMVTMGSWLSGVLWPWIKDIVASVVKGIFGIHTGTTPTQGGAPTPHGNDFIWRPGSGMATINPNDTVVGYKGAPPNLSGSGGGDVMLNVTYNVNIADKSQIQRMMDENNQRLFEKVRSLRPV